MTNILVIEDDIALCDGIVLALKNDGTSLHKAYNLKSAKDFLTENKVDLIILDINLPDGNGVGFLAEYRKTSNTKTILLTANDLETDIITGLERGADDYITKPFSLAVLRARVNTQLRQKSSENTYKNGAFYFDFDKMEFYVSGQNIDLSKTEQKLLKLLTDNNGITLKREFLVDRIWTDGLDYVDENALSVSVKRLRTKLGKDSCIKTVYGIGYMWQNV